MRTTARLASAALALSCAFAASGATVKTATQPWVTARIAEATNSLGGVQTEADPTVGLTNGTLYVKGETIKPITAHQSLDGYATKDDLKSAGKVQSVNGATGAVSVTAASIGAATTDALADVEKSVGEVWSYMKGETFRVVVTNYDSAVNPPRVRYEYRMSTNEDFRVVWTETNGLASAVAEATNLAAAATQAIVDKPANRAWGGWDSHTGEAAPDGVVQVSGGGGLLIGSESGWTQFNATGGSYWVLTSTDPTLRANGTNGVFAITDPDGKSVMTIRKGDKRLVYAAASAVQAGASSLAVTYEVISDKAPTAECALALDGTWYSQGASGAPFSIAWSGQSGAWTMTATAPSGGAWPTTGFFRAVYETGGDTEVVYDAAIGLTKVSIGGVQYTVGTAEINGQTVLTLTK